MKFTSAYYERVNWSRRNWNFKIKTIKGRKTACEITTFQRYLSSINKASIVEVLDSPAAVIDHLLAKFFIDIGKRMATIMNLTPCRVCSELYRGSFPKAGLLSLSFRHSKGNWRHRSSTAVNINKFSCCNTSQFKHLVGPSDLNSRAVFFFRCGHLQHRSISERQFKIFNGTVAIIQETQKRPRVFIAFYTKSSADSVYIVFSFTDRAARLLSKFEALFCRNWCLAVDSWECRWNFSRHIVTQLY